MTRWATSPRMMFCFGRRESIPARRRALQIRTFVARREDYRNLARREQASRAGKPEVYLNSPLDSSQNR